MAASALPRDVLLAVLWADFGRDDASVPLAEGDGSIAYYPLSREREHRARSVAMALVCRGWNDAVEEDVGRRMLVRRCRALRRLVNSRGRTRATRVLIYAPVDLTDLAGAVLVAELVSKSPALRGLFIHGRLPGSEADEGVESVFDVRPPSPWPETLVVAVIPFEWTASAVTQCTNLRALQSGFVQDEPLEESLPLFASIAPAALVHLDFNIALRGFMTTLLGQWLGRCTALEQLRIRYMDESEFELAFGREADGRVMLDRLRGLTIDAVGEWELENLTWLAPSIESITIINGACLDSVYAYRLEFMVGLPHYQRFLEQGGHPRLRSLHLIDCFSAVDHAHWSSLAATCEERNIDFSD